MRKIAVIGSSCFTGSHIVDAFLDAGDAVVGISRSSEPAAMFLPHKRHGDANFAFHRIDAVKAMPALIRLLDAEKPEIVIFVAALSEVALSNERPVEYFDINTTAVVRLCEHLRHASWLKRYVHISSAEIFGPCAAAAPETAPFSPSTPYAVSKAAADMHLGVLARNAGFPVTIVRSTNVYGARQQLFKIIPRSVIYIKQGRTIELHGGGAALKSFVHIRDVVRGLMAAVEQDAPGPFHFSVDSNLSVADVVGLVCRKMKAPFETATRTIGERLGQDARYWLDCTKARRDLGWSPRIDMAEGIAEVVDWIDANWRQIQAQPLEYRHRV
jgi:dTDP-glucose 4,6-dehydratase